MKRKIQSVQCFMKKLRSNFPRRKRSQISPILCPSLSSIVSDSIVSSYLTREVSCESSRASVNKPNASLKKRSFAGISGVEFRRITRSYQKQKENEKTKEKEELSESSCVESCSVAGERSSYLKSGTRKGAEKAKEIIEIEDSEAITRSEVSFVQRFSGKILKSEGEKVNTTENSAEIRRNEVVSGTSVIGLPAESNICKLFDNTIKDGETENRVFRDDISEITRNFVESNFTNSNSASMSEQLPKLVSMEFDLACSEQLSTEEHCGYSSAFSELQSELFADSSDIDFSDYTPSIWCESGSQFSERSVGDSSPSPTFQLFSEYSQQFCRSTSAIHSKVSSRVEGEGTDCHGIQLLRFEDEEHELSYQMIRNRERRQVYLHDYAEDYRSTDCGELVIQQRLQIVHWIIEQSINKEFQRETMFLGVSLFDRFLSKGYFKNKRNLQIAGIACFTLATRIEENQPFNSVRQKIFNIGSNVYSRCEVVAMEWLVQEVLNFQCFLPTLYNFLWFYLKAARANEQVEKTAKYLAVLALLSHEQLCYWPSTVAAGLVILASIAANKDATCHQVTETHARTKDDELPECIESLEWLVKYIS